MAETKPWCCYIDQDTQESCTSAASFEIQAMTGYPEEDTHACVAHVGALLGSNRAEPVWGEYHFEVRVLSSTV